jgi:hypothetical protein
MIDKTSLCIVLIHHVHLPVLFHLGGALHEQALGPKTKNRPEPQKKFGRAQTGTDAQTSGHTEIENP